MLSMSATTKTYSVSLLQGLEFELSLKNFGESLRGLARGLWSGEIDKNAFTNGMYFSLDNFYELAWREGEAKVGILEGERSPASEKARLEFLLEDITKVEGLAIWLLVNNKESGTAWSTIVARIDLWINRYEAAVSAAMALAGKDQKLKWMFGETEKHCGSCLKLNGKVKRASVWQAANIQPRMRTLECKGYRCDCRFEVTNEPLTRGPLPQIP